MRVSRSKDRKRLAALQFLGLDDDVEECSLHRTKGKTKQEREEGRREGESQDKGRAPSEVCQYTSFRSRPELRIQIALHRGFNAERLHPILMIYLSFVI